MTNSQVLSRRLDGVSESATLKLNAAVQAMKSRGEDVVNLTAGEPDFWVPDSAKEAAIEAVRANRSKYTPVAGIPELREAIVAKTHAQQREVFGRAPWKAADVVVSNGGKQALFNSLLALIDAGDEVLIPSPYWLSYPEMVKLCGGVPRMIEAPFVQGFKITPQQLREAIRAAKRVKAFVINSPSNPTGAMYTRAELAELGEVLLTEPNARETWVISDEIYDRDVLGDVPFCSFLEAVPELRDRCVTVNGMSKSAAMTGWRIGWSVAPQSVTSGISTLQGQSTSGINAIAQWASVAALKLPESAFAEQVASLRKRRDLCLDILKQTGKLEVSVPDGAFYLFIGVGAWLSPGEDSIAFAERMLVGAKVAVVPGTPFGAPAYLRLSFATDEKSLSKGCERIKEFLEREKCTEASTNGRVPVSR